VIFTVRGHDSGYSWRAWKNHVAICEGVVTRKKEERCALTDIWRTEKKAAKPLFILQQPFDATTLTNNEFTEISGVSNE
jgi:hypothetical protein